MLSLCCLIGIRFSNECLAMNLSAEIKDVYVCVSKRNRFALFIDGQVININGEREVFRHMIIMMIFHDNI